MKFQFKHELRGKLGDQVFYLISMRTAPPPSPHRVAWIQVSVDAISVQSLLLVYFSVPTRYLSRYNSVPLYPATNLPKSSILGRCFQLFVSGDAWKAIGLLSLDTVKYNPLSIKLVLITQFIFNFIDEVKEVRAG